MSELDPEYDFNQDYRFPMDEQPGVNGSPEPAPYDDNAHNRIDQPVASGGGSGHDANASIGEGRSTTWGQADQYTQDALKAGVPQSFIDSKLKSDPGDYSRLISSYNSKGGGGSATPRSAAPQDGGGGGNTAPAGNPRGDEVYGYLKGLFPGGGFNQSVVNSRLDSARSSLEAGKKSAQRNNEAYLADRGLIGSGPQASANENLESRLFGQFGAASNDIYANESENADKRMMGALQAATGMTEVDAQNAIEQFRANTERDLGFGNLALGNKNADNSFTLGQGNLSLGQGQLAIGNFSAQNDYNLGAGRLQNDRDTLAHLIQQGDTNAMLEYLKLLQSGAGTSANGYIG